MDTQGYPPILRVIGTEKSLKIHMLSYHLDLLLGGLYDRLDQLKQNAVMHV